MSKKSFIDNLIDDYLSFLKDIKKREVGDFQR